MRPSKRLPGPPLHDATSRLCCNAISWRSAAKARPFYFAWVVFTILALINRHGTSKTRVNAWVKGCAAFGNVRSLIWRRGAPGDTGFIPARRVSIFRAFEKAFAFDEEPVVVRLPIIHRSARRPHTIIAFEHGCPHRKRLEDWSARRSEMPERMIELGSYPAFAGLRRRWNRLNTVAAQCLEYVSPLASDFRSTRCRAARIGLKPFSSGARVRRTSRPCNSSSATTARRAERRCPQGNVPVLRFRPGKG
jgi:hypothetical protein